MDVASAVASASRVAMDEGDRLDDGTELAFGVPGFSDSEAEDSDSANHNAAAPDDAGCERAMELLIGMEEHNHERRGLADSGELDTLGRAPVQHRHSMPLLEYRDVAGGLPAGQTFRPFVLRGVPEAESWPAYAKWCDKETFLSHYGQVPVQITEMSAAHGFGKPFRVELTLQKFADYATSNRVDWPFYSWERQWDGPRAALLQDFQAPRCFADDLYDTDERTREFLPLTCHLFVLVGGPRSGSNVHQDPKWSSAWNTLLVGRKRWVMFPPSVPKEAIGALGDYKSGGPPAYWWLDVYPRLREDPSSGLCECIQEPGDTVFIPSGWWHAVLNLPDPGSVTICCTRNCFLKEHLPEVLPLMRQRYPAFASRFVSTLRDTRPDISLAQEDSSATEERPLEVGNQWRLHRRACEGLSLAEARRDYFRLGRPLIITGLEAVLALEESFGCSLEWIRDNFGDKVVRVGTNYSPDRPAEEALKDEFVDFAEAIRRVEEGIPGTYLYDLPLRELPAILQQVRIPRYFGHCYLQRTRLPHYFQRAWPTLFIGAPGTQSSLHVDQWHGAFWMSLLSGRKRWTIWHPEDAHLLSPQKVAHRHAPLFPHIDKLAASPDFLRARRIDVTLHAGEVLFVPGGAPHLVVNETVSVAVAGNFVDEANVSQVMADLRVMAPTNQRADGLLQALQELDFDEDLGMWDDLLQPAALVFSANDAQQVHNWSAQPPLS